MHAIFVCLILLVFFKIYVKIAWINWTVFQTEFWPNLDWLVICQTKETTNWTLSIWKHKYTKEKDV